MTADQTTPTPGELSEADREALAEPVYDAYRLGRYGPAEYLPMWHELAKKPTGTPEHFALFERVETLLAAQREAIAARLDQHAAIAGAHISGDDDTTTITASETYRHAAALARAVPTTEEQADE